MNANNTFHLINSEQIDLLLTNIQSIKADIEEIKKSADTVKEDTSLLTTKEAMIFLKLNHLNTFKNYLKKNRITPISEFKPFRYKKSDLIKSR